MFQKQRKRSNIKREAYMPIARSDTSTERFVIFKEKELSVTKNRDVREQKRKKRKGGRKKGCETVGEEPDLKS